MKTQTNSLGQVIGYSVEGWSGAHPPARQAMVGRFCRLEPLNAETHVDDLYEAQALDAEGRNWTYLSYGPPTSRGEYHGLLSRQSSSSDPLFFAIMDQQTGKAVGVASYLRVFPDLGSIEIGHLYFSPLLQRTPAATEGIYLMIQRALVEMGYRRCEWKCDSLNQPSKDAAVRFGFQYEGTFRQAAVGKGRNRDTAWYSILDGEWKTLGLAFERWLAAGNFDSEGQQRERLSALTRQARANLVETGLHQLS